MFVFTLAGNSYKSIRQAHLKKPRVKNLLGACRYSFALADVGAAVWYKVFYNLLCRSYSSGIEAGILKELFWQIKINSDTLGIYFLPAHSPPYHPGNVSGRHCGLSVFVHGVRCAYPSPAGL